MFIFFDYFWDNISKCNRNQCTRFLSSKNGARYPVHYFYFVLYWYLSDLKSCLYYLLNALYNKFTNYFFAHNPVKVFGSIHIENVLMDSGRWIVFSRKDPNSAHSFCRFSGGFLIAAFFFAKRQKINKKPHPFLIGGYLPTSSHIKAIQICHFLN